MGAFAVSAGERVSYKCSVEEWIEFAVQGVVQESISDACLVNVSRFWVVYLEWLVRAVSICSGLECFVQRQDVVHECVLEFLDVFLITLAWEKFTPRLEDIFD